MSAPNFRLDGKVALITGSARGIGLAIAKAFAAQGASIVLQDIDRDAALLEADALTKSGTKAAALGGDVTDLGLAKELVEKTVSQLGGLHILVNNASIQAREHWLEMPIESMRKQFDADLLFPIELAKHAAKVMQQQKWGRIINIGSIQQKGANETMLAYSVSKSGLEKATLAMARSLGPDGITVNSIAPGWIANTLRNQNDFTDADDKVAKGKWMPLRRVGEPQDIVGAAVLLASPAGEYITGQSLYVDGGMSAR